MSIFRRTNETNVGIVFVFMYRDEDGFHFGATNFMNARKPDCSITDGGKLHFTMRFTVTDSLIFWSMLLVCWSSVTSWSEFDASELCFRSRSYCLRCFRFKCLWKLPVDPVLSLYSEPHIWQCPTTVPFNGESNSKKSFKNSILFAGQLDAIQENQQVFLMRVFLTVCRNYTLLLMTLEEQVSNRYRDGSEYVLRSSVLRISNLLWIISWNCWTKIAMLYTYIVWNTYTKPAKVFFWQKLGQVSPVNYDC